MRLPPLTIMKLPLPLCCLNSLSHPEGFPALTSTLRSREAIQQCSAKSGSFQIVLHALRSLNYCFGGKSRYSAHAQPVTSKLSRLMGHHGRGQHPCPLCDLEGPQLQAASVLRHMVDHHRREINLDRDCTEGVLMGRLIYLNISFLPKFRNLYVLC